MASAIIRKTLNKLIYLELTAIVSCEIGRVTIDVTQDGAVVVDGIIDSNGRRQPVSTYKKSETEQLIGYMGEITEIMTLNHETDEESFIF